MKLRFFLSFALVALTLLLSGKSQGQSLSPEDKGSPKHLTEEISIHHVFIGGTTSSPYPFDPGQDATIQLAATLPEPNNISHIYWKVWVDADLNGSFSASEVVFSTSTPYPETSGTLTFPSSLSRINEYPILVAVRRKPITNNYNEGVDDTYFGDLGNNPFEVILGDNTCPCQHSYPTARPLCHEKGSDFEENFNIGIPLPLGQASVPAGTHTLSMEAQIYAPNGSPATLPGPNHFSNSWPYPPQNGQLLDTLHKVLPVRFKVPAYYILPPSRSMSISFECFAHHNSSQGNLKTSLGTVTVLVKVCLSSKKDDIAHTPIDDGMLSPYGRSLGSSESPMTEEAALFSHFPNPVRDVLHLHRADKSRPVRVTLLNAQGQPVLQKIIYEKWKTLHLGHLPPGIYYLRETDGQEQTTQKLLKY